MRGWCFLQLAITSNIVLCSLVTASRFLKPCTQFRCEQISTELLDWPELQRQLIRLSSGRHPQGSGVRFWPQDEVRTRTPDQGQWTADPGAGVKRSGVRGIRTKYRNRDGERKESWTRYLNNPNIRDNSLRNVTNTDGGKMRRHWRALRRRRRMRKRRRGGHRKALIQADNGHKYANQTVKTLRAGRRFEESAALGFDGGNNVYARTKRGSGTRQKDYYRSWTRNDEAKLRKHKRWTPTTARTVLQLAAWRKKKDGCHKFAIFRVFGNDFVLCLLLASFQDDTILVNSGDLRVSIYGEDNEYRTRKLSSMYLQLAEGHLIGEEFSSVRGYVWRDKFYGLVQTASYTLQIEPLSKTGPVITRYNSISNRVFNAYVYRVFYKKRSETNNDSRRKTQDRDSVLEGINSVYHQPFVQDSGSSGQFTHDWSEDPNPTKPPRCRSCSLLLIADDSFYKEIGEGTVKQSVLQMLYHVRESNILLRKLDFDEDRVPDCLSLHVAGVGVITSPLSNDNILTGNFTTPEQYLKAFSRYQFDGYCLSVLFSSRLFGKHVLGLAWQGRPDLKSGACQRRTNVLNNEIREEMNLNSLFITLRTRVSDRIPLRMGILNLAHEILHSFGSKHDNRSEICTPKDVRTNGRYLMSRFSGSGVLSNNEKISPCTASSINDGLSDMTQSYCLHPSTLGYCGDGVIGEDEECDCGDVLTCLASLSCCTPPGLRRGNTQCKWRNIPACKNKTELSDHDLKVYKSMLRKQSKFARDSVQRRVGYCDILGLKKCRHCRGGDCVCCREQNGRCTPSSTLVINHFRRMQRVIGECGDFVMACVTRNPSWSAFLHHLSSRQPDGRGTVLCLRSKLDSNCWQLNFNCKNRP